MSIAQAAPQDASISDVDPFFIGIADPAQRRYNNTLRGLASLPVAITPAGA